MIFISAFLSLMNECQTDTHKTETESVKDKNVELAHQGKDCATLECFVFLWRLTRISFTFDHPMIHPIQKAARAMLDGTEGGSDEENEWAEQVRRHRQRLHHSWVEADHPGCQLSGHLLLDRVPGNFHVQARSPHHDLVPHLTNVSHVIHSMSIGEPVVSKLLVRGIQNGNLKVPADMQTKIAPMDGNVYINTELHEASTTTLYRIVSFPCLGCFILERICSYFHSPVLQAYHHYLKVVTTNIEGLVMGRRQLKAYQIIQSSQLAYYRNDVVPEAKVRSYPYMVLFESESVNLNNCFLLRHSSFSIFRQLQ